MGRLEASYIGTMSDGRPTKKPTSKEQLALLKRACAAGLTMAQLGELWGVSERTIYQWQTDPKVLKAIRDGKKVADKKVEESLYVKATGYNYDETTYECDPKKYNDNEIHVAKIITKHVPPSDLAIIYWTKNRMPDRWKDRREQDIKLRGIEDLVKELK